MIGAAGKGLTLGLPGVGMVVLHQQRPLDVRGLKIAVQQCQWP